MQKYIKSIFIEKKINETAGFINEMSVFINKWLYEGIKIGAPMRNAYIKFD